MVLAVAALAFVATRASLDSPDQTSMVDEPPTTTAPAPTDPSTTTSSQGPSTTSAPATTATTAPATTTGEAAPSTTAPPAPAPTTTTPIPTGPFDPFGLIEAEGHDAQRGVVTTPMAGGGHTIGAVADGDHVAFHDVAFGTSLATRFEARVASGIGGDVEGTIEVRLDDVASPPFATIRVTGTGGWTTFTTLAADTPAIGGTHDVYVTFSSPQPADFAAVDWFRFRR